MQTLEATIVQMTAAWEQGGAADEMREIIGAIDEILFERMMLVFQDLSTGYLMCNTLLCLRCNKTV
jgi:hypothetical protein